MGRCQRQEGFPEGHANECGCGKYRCDTIAKPACRIFRRSLQGKTRMMEQAWEDVCLRNGCTDLINIKPLTGDEAWDLFKNTVGAPKIDSLQDTSLARKVCKECGAMPLLIHAVGNALKFVTENAWKDALFQLENCNLEEIDGTESRAYTCIKLSFDKLPRAEKTCLLLCSLFHDDADIDIKMLKDIATGSQLLSRQRNVRGIVDKLKSSSLLLEGKNISTVKMHDIIRDVARSIASKDQEYAFLFIGGDWPLTDIDDCSTRKLLHFVESGNYGCPTVMVCPRLHTLWLECNDQPQQFSDSFFKGLDNLKILVFKGMDIFPERMSVQTFDKLSMLILEGCDLHELFLSIVPENLETLRISECRLPNPLDLRKLKYLRKLEVVTDSEIERVQIDISSLSPTLEELHIPSGFKICDAERNGSVPISSELNKLTALSSLNIRLEDSGSCPAENIVANLLDFIIDVGEKLYPHGIEMRSVVFNDRCIEGGGQVLVERAEEVVLKNVKGSRNGFSNNNREAFSELKRLYIDNCEDMEQLVWIPHNDIQQTQPLPSFSKLSSLAINGCSGLKYLFCACFAKCLVQLQELSISGCHSLEVVIKKESTSDGAIIRFPKLKSLTLSHLSSLRRFYGECRRTIMEKAASSAAESDSLFGEMVALPELERLRLQGLETSEIWEKNGYKDNSFCQLKSLQIWTIHNLEFAIPLAMLHTFQNLEELMVYNCYKMTSEVERSSSSKESSNTEPALVALRSFRLEDMDNLTETRLNSTRRNLYPNIETLFIHGCNGLRNVFLPSIAKDLAVHLKQLVVRQCEMMTEIIGAEGDDEERNGEFVFPVLTKLELYDLPYFESFFSNESVKAQSTTPEHQSYLLPKVLFPKLVEIEVGVRTIKMEEIELSRNDSTSEIRSLVIECEEEVQLPSKWQLQLPNIERLCLENCSWHEYSGEHNVGQLLINPCNTFKFPKIKGG